ncbi:MAG: DoxX family protein [Actinomycetota bacterium]|nr:DoxX family protein [Actinomycetota bacterium]
MNIGLLIVRMVVGLLFVGHGTQKLFGWFGGDGLEGTGQFMAHLGFRPGTANAGLAGASETGGGLLLALGFLTPLGAAAIIGVMVSTLALHAPKGLWATRGGYEYPLVNAAVAACIALAGPGKFSVDGAAGMPVNDMVVGSLAIGAGIAAGVLRLATRTPAPATEAEGRQTKAA